MGLGNYRKNIREHKCQGCGTTIRWEPEFCFDCRNSGRHMIRKAQPKSPPRRMTLEEEIQAFKSRSRPKRSIAI